jgi:hypothetical protein
MTDKYILNVNGDPEPCESLKEWAQWLETSDERRVVARDEQEGVRVSTVFLGLDHAFGGSVPILFETMIFGGPHNDFQERYTSRTEALDGHRRAVELAFS